MGKANPRAALGASSARIDMELEDKLSRITAPTLIVTTKESGLQSVEAVESYAARISSARGIVPPGGRFYVAAGRARGVAPAAPPGLAGGFPRPKTAPCPARPVKP